MLKTIKAIDRNKTDNFLGYHYTNKTDCVLQCISESQFCLAAKQLQNKPFLKPANLKSVFDVNNFEDYTFSL